MALGTVTVFVGDVETKSFDIDLPYGEDVSFERNGQHLLIHLDFDPSDAPVEHGEGPAPQKARMRDESVTPAERGDQGPGHVHPVDEPAAEPEPEGDQSDPSSLTKPELKAILAEQGKPTSGTKPELLARLAE